ncbi:MAG: hydrogenase iron-sulfur subunit [Candidatus Eremiobacteraeota bacterium]|nr:hydrogenase iron-sulfur subunit [Candidatus Eremiobacteraeota bacterium]MCW5869892.1 hydrogenase iron-sulfur subunit [Candidatus Eremiobacteraeota bacterium]
MIPRKPKLSRLLGSWLAPWERLVSWFFGPDYNPTYQSGVLAVYLLALVVASGLPLLFFYKVGAPYESVQWVQGQWALGWLRGLHRYASDAAVVAVFFHALRMLQGGRTSGPRRRAWLSGLALLGLMIFIGVLGLVMVWDEQGEKLAVQGIQFLAGLPFFSEPPGRIFADNQALGESFFFMLIFLHVALPLVLVFLFLAHTSRTARARYWPERHLVRAYGWGLAGLALCLPVPLAAPADLLRLPGRVYLDPWYGFWLPAAEKLGTGGTLLALGLLLLGLGSLPWWWAVDGPGRAQASVVDESSCTGCTQCVQDCPYDAIEMVKRTHLLDGRHSPLVALVNSDLCVSCGLCAASCAPMGVGPPQRTGRDQLRAAEQFASTRDWREGDVVLLACRWGSGEHPGWSAIPGIHCYPTGCCGSIHTSVLELFLRKGAAGVFVLTCPERDCSQREGPKWLRLRVYEDREAELQARVDRRRVRLFACPGVEVERARRELLAFRQELLKDPAGQSLPEGELRCRSSEVQDGQT